jgi:restriction endonuclease S subunit
MNYFRPHLEKYALPEGWIQLPLKRFIVSMTSGSRPSGGAESDVNGVFSLGGEHIDDHGGLRFNNMTYVPRPFFQTIREDAGVEVSDTLLNKDGAKTGKVAFVDDTFPFHEACINEHVFRIRADRSKVADRNLFYFLLSSLGQAQLSKYIQGSAQPGINQRFPKFLLMRVPTDPDEQSRIAETLKAADGHIRAVEEQIRKAERVKKALLQSIFVEGLPGRNKTPQALRWGVAPDGWTETSIRRLLTEPAANGISPDAARREPPGYPTLNVSSIRNGRCDQSKLSYIELPEKIATAFAVLLTSIIVNFLTMFSGSDSVKLLQGYMLCLQ